MIKVQKENFFLEEEISKICSKNNNIGAISTFTGVVRNKRKDEELVFMRLDHYPKMALKMTVHSCGCSWSALKLLII